MTSVRVTTKARPLPRERRDGERTRPPLRVLPPDYVHPRVRRRRARLFLGAMSSLVVLGLFGIAALHVVLTQGQFRLQQLENRANEQQARYEQLRLQVAQLESPERVVAVAQERLGMVSPPGVTYLSPSGPAVDEPVDDGPATPATSGPSTSWAEVKPHLADQP
jgi:cell division protein FtsL